MKAWLTVLTVAVLGCKRPTAEQIELCRRSYECGWAGQCTADREGLCFASTAEDCRKSDRCRDKDQHACTLLKGQCVPSDADCSTTDSCRVVGWCTASLNRCLAAKDGDCSKTGGCTALGMCSARKGNCVVAKDEDCARTPECTTWARCSAVEGKCIASREDCKKSKLCAEKGLCAASNGNCIVDK